MKHYRGQAHPPGVLLGVRAAGLGHRRHVDTAQRGQNLVQGGQRGVHLLEHGGLLLVDRQGQAQLDLVLGHVLCYSSVLNEYY